MKTAYLILASMSLLVLTSCKEEKEKPKVIYDTAAKPKAAAPKLDSTLVEIADLPVQITGTNYLIHPVGDVRLYERAGYSANGTSGNISYSISNYNEFEITGFLHNLKFQQMDSDSLKVLTDKQILMQTATYLKPIADKSKMQLMVYTLADMDTNKDGKLDVNDIKTLYISTINGDKFTKLSPDLQELIDWKLLEHKNRIYFRTIEDTNKNGEFDKADVLHYYFVDLLAKEWTASAYKPV